MKRIVWSILLVIPVGAVAADVYRSVDANGVVTYSDLPTTQSERVTIVASRAGSTTTPRSEAAGRTQNETAGDSPLVAEIPREPTADELAADRERNCGYARQKLETFSQSHRLFRNGPDGERIYLSDDELTAARVKAESDVAEWCG